MNLYEYKATVIKVHDGDTLHLKIDLGFKIFWEVNCRLALLNTPELGAGGEIAQKFVQDYFPIGTKVLLKSKLLDLHGRPISIVYKEGEEISINDILLKNGMAEPYPKPVHPDINPTPTEPTQTTEPTKLTDTEIAEQN